jgi:hypothetical protein
LPHSGRAYPRVEEQNGNPKNGVVNSVRSADPRCGELPISLFS